MAEFQPFEMERMMSKCEQEVDYNLSESGVHPVTLSELVDDPAVVQALLATELNYPYVNGVLELRENIAALYRGATPENVLVTVGALRPTIIAMRTLLSPGDEIVRHAAQLYADLGHRQEPWLSTIKRLSPARRARLGA